MIVYRLSRTRWADDLTGEGSRLHGGRWNHPGTPCIYTSESRALAILEYTVNVNVDDEHYHRKIAPVTLQNLVENAIKHNTSEPNSPLRISLYVMNDYMIVRNNLQKKSFVETSNKQGLSNMESLYHYLSDRPMVIIEDEQYFTVKIPLL